MLHEGAAQVRYFQPRVIIFARCTNGNRSCRSIDRYLQGAQQQTHRPPLLLLTDSTDRQTDGRTSERYVDSYVGNVKHELDRLVLVTNRRCANDTNHHTSRHVALLITPSFSYLHKICSQKNRQKYSWRANRTALRYKYQQRKFYK